MLRFNRKWLPYIKVSSTSGFTLIEVLVAMIILAIGLMGIASMMATSARGGAYGRRTTVAENLALQKLEQFRNLSYTNVKALTEVPSNGVKNANQCSCPTGFSCVASLSSCTLQNDPTCILNLSANELVSTELEDYGTVIGDPEPGGSSFKRVTVVRALNGCPVPQSEGLARVTVTVSWRGSQPSGQIQAHSVQLGTFVSK
jgi:prepilin-type N-terminal cleavage/methylation domain-containing protein